MSQLLPQQINEDKFETHWIDSGLMFAELNSTNSDASYVIVKK